jgi:pyruvate formate lyase activating enzyme
MMDISEVLAEVARDMVFYETSGGGVTFSGGEPFFQPRFLRELAGAVKAEGVHTALETNLVAPIEVVRSILDDMALFIVDLKACEGSVLHDEKIPWIRGNRFAVIGENLELLRESGKEIWIRIPLVEEYTDSNVWLQRVLDLIGSHRTGISRLELLPYHAIGENKRGMLGMEERVFVPPAEARIEEIFEMFKALAVPLRVLHAHSL